MHYNNSFFRNKCCKTKQKITRMRIIAGTEPLRSNWKRVYLTGYLRTCHLLQITLDLMKMVSISVFATVTCIFVKEKTAMSIINTIKLMVIVSAVVIKYSHLEYPYLIEVAKYPFTTARYSNMILFTTTIRVIIFRLGCP